MSAEEPTVAVAVQQAEHFNVPVRNCIMHRTKPGGVGLRKVLVAVQCVGDALDITGETQVVEGEGHRLDLDLLFQSRPR